MTTREERDRALLPHPDRIDHYEAAHDAYHKHNETCACRTVGCLTRFITDAVLDAQEHDDGHEIN